jgi:hypothetical protein
MSLKSMTNLRCTTWNWTATKTLAA